MFTQITLKNYKTHKLTNIDLRPVTLLIGNNNSGKSNLLEGIQHFSNLVKRGHLDNKDDDKKIFAKDLFNRHRLASTEDSMGFKILWNNANNDNITYEIDLRTVPTKIDNVVTHREEWRHLGHVSCIEKIKISTSDHAEKKIISGNEKKTDLVKLRQKIEDTTLLNLLDKQLCRDFFQDFDHTFSYHFQPTFLKHDEYDPTYQMIEGDFAKIPDKLGRNGLGLQAIIRYIKENDEHTFAKFTALLRRFEINFQSVRYEDLIDKLLWGFDLAQKGEVQEFLPDSVSDGFMKAAAISLLASLDKPPALILLEEIENGINPGNIQELMRWIWQMTSPNSRGFTTQFIITSHSPSVLREFHDHLDHVYTVRLQKRDRTSDVRNLNTSLDTLVGIGTVEGEIIEDPITGKRTVDIPKYQLAELWYSGTIG